MVGVHIHIEGAQARVTSPFEARDVIKRIPAGARSWDAERKVWLIDAPRAEELRLMLVAAGFDVRVTRRKPPAPPPPPDVRDWAEVMFAELGPELASRAYRALVVALHPDHGGDVRAMQCLNAARDRARAREAA